MIVIKDINSINLELITENGKIINYKFYDFEDLKESAVFIEETDEKFSSKFNIQIDINCNGYKATANQNQKEN